MANRGISVQLFDYTDNQQANLTNLQAIWFDDAEPKNFISPVGRTFSATTDASGYLKLNLENATSLVVGDYGFLLVYKLDDSDHRDSLIFASRLQIEEIEGGDPATTLDLSYDEWERNTSWLSMPTITNTENKFVGLYAVYPHDSNFCALTFATTEGYTVNWGDGNTENFGTFSSNAWSTGGPLATARNSLAGAGTQTAGLSFGGTTGSTTAVTEEYNGSSWSAGGNLATARYGLAGAGTQTAGLSFGGWVSAVSAVTEEYDGASWSSGGNLTTARQYLAGAGTQTAGLSFGGSTGSVSAVTEEYDGASWSSGGNLVTARNYLAGAGTQTAGLSFGGYTTSVSAVTEEYDGASWSAGGNLATARYNLAGAGTQTAGLSFGGYAGGALAVTEEYDGSSWSTGGTLATARYNLAGAGTQTAGLSFGGYSGINLVVTEEYGLVVFGVAAKHDYSYASVPGTTDVGIADAFAVTFDAASDTVNKTDHKLLDGSLVAFSSITNTTGISTHTHYYVVNASANSFQVADTFGGTAKALTTNGTGSCYTPIYRQVLVTVTSQGAAPFTSIDLQTPYFSYGKYSSNWLELKFSAPSLISLKIGYKSGIEVKHPKLERCEVVSSLDSVTDFSYLFSSCNELQSVSFADTSHVVNFDYMFYSCYSLKAVPALDTSAGTTFIYMFRYCYSLQFLYLPDTSTATTGFGSAFSNCNSLACVILPDLSSNTGSLSNMFYGAHRLEYLYMPKTPLATNFSYLCYECKVLRTVVLSDTASATNFYYAFYNCYKLVNVPLFDTSHVTDFRNVFYNCYALEKVPSFDLSSVTQANYAFRATGLTNPPAFNLSSATTIYGMFYECRRLKSVTLTTSASLITATYAFFNCSQLKEVSLFNTSKVTNFQRMFYLCYLLQSVPFFDTSSATVLDGMFNECSSLKEVPLFDLSKAQNCSSMFYYCYSLETIPPFNLSAATNTSGMFYNCSALQSVPKLDLSKSTTCESMFYQCGALVSVPVLNVTLSATNGYMFYGCYSLQKGTLTNIKKNIDYSYCNLSSTEIDNIFNNLYTIGSGTGQYITISYNWGANKVALSGTTVTGSTSVSMANTTGLEANMWITGTGISTGVAVTFQDTGDTVTRTAHGIPAGTPVAFSSITSTTGITIYTPYYVVNPQTDTFQVSDTVGGSAKALTTNGSGTAIYGTYIVSIVPNTSITISIPASSSATNTLTFTKCNVIAPTLKRWTVTNA